MEAVIRHLGDLKFEAAARGHRVVSDQPLENGGSDAGMTPPASCWSRSVPAPHTTLCNISGHAGWKRTNSLSGYSPRRPHSRRASRHSSSTLKCLIWIRSILTA